MFNVIQRIVDEELEFRNDAELLADSCAKLEANLLLIGVDVLHYLLCLLAWEDAEIDATHAQVGADAASTDAHQNASHRTGLLLKDVAQLLLNEASYLVLSGCFHINLLLGTLGPMLADELASASAGRERIRDSSDGLPQYGTYTRGTIRRSS